MQAMNLMSARPENRPGVFIPVVLTHNLQELSSLVLNFTGSGAGKRTHDINEVDGF